ncbi:MAG: Bro-N domain-containing protein [Patescibacteria group bacterium]|nr:Bro-N domain-containing protein [Patescibacteria group bacterium]MBU1684129.1 Bro-N domain-containing protein [Patescibacteria group bacterium]MBU1778327.1 Bro-N domain-containing protein [Patescibacteria group bacterium]MBU2474732.1 Bro-N domain-containing protein [Patescibacteria group bacterium]
MLKKQSSQNKSIIIFEDTPVRRIWVEKEQKWYFSVVDIIKILTDSPTPRQYWSKIKDREFKQFQLSPIWVQLKLKSADGKKYLTDCADVKGIFRIIQSIPSKKAEPFKQWLAKVGYERLQETVDPEIAINRVRKNWKQFGMSEKWIEQRMRGQEIRNKLTDYWSENEVKKEIEYAKLTDIIHQEWSELTTEQHKKLKNLKHENLRNNMTEAELLFTALAELSTTKIAKKEQAKGYNENAVSAKKGGGIAKSAKQQLEEATGEKVVSSKKYLTPKQGIKKII